MARFFIDRPVFAWVLAIFIILAGVLAIPRLAVERSPAVAPPSGRIYASYPGASQQTLNDAVVGLIERELSSVKHLLYFESSVDTSGEASITAPGTPAAASRAWAASRHLPSVAGDTMIVRRLAPSNAYSVSRPTVRPAFKPCADTEGETSSPNGVTMISASASGVAPVTSVAPSFSTSAEARA
ncbi:hypothetical protein G6F50_013630 [Rhizopus delemar]|uniref:Uncharacterized protein n=1 Tax=Rhizopus delemar TaxID=936053 RepID=A0A9P6YER6_9FUNG|nr:hypothetical protein G6F50_013630 [Rhizopus delemar]